MFGILFCFVLTAAVASTTSQSAPQPAQAGDDPSPATMIKEVPFHPLAFSFPCWVSRRYFLYFWNLVFLVIHALQYPNSFFFNFEISFCAYFFVFLVLPLVEELRPCMLPECRTIPCMIKFLVD